MGFETEWPEIAAKLTEFGRLTQDAAPPVTEENLPPAYMAQTKDVTVKPSSVYLPYSQRTAQLVRFSNVSRTAQALLDAALYETGHPTTPSNHAGATSFHNSRDFVDLLDEQRIRFDIADYVIDPEQFTRGGISVLKSKLDSAIHLARTDPAEALALLDKIRLGYAHKQRMEKGLQIVGHMAKTINELFPTDSEADKRGKEEFVARLANETGVGATILAQTMRQLKDEQQSQRAVG